MLKLSTMFKVLVVSALVMGFGLMVIGSDVPAPIQPLPEGDGADFDLKEQLAPVHQDPEEDVIPDQSTIDQKEAERLALATQHRFELDLRSMPEAGEAEQYMHPLAEVFFEGFNTEVPPTGWTTIVNNAFTWEFDNYNPYEGAGNATCLYDENYTGPQDEWLISPSINLSSGGPYYVDFAWMMSYYWGVDPNDNYDMYVMVSDDDGANWTQAWTEPTEAFTSYEWYTAEIGPYSSSTFKIAFVYQGYDGAQGGFDAISINDAAPPVGRCCYGPEFLDCADNTEVECDALGGHWTLGLNCTDNPCPSVPPNDDPENAIEIFPPETVTGSTAAATIDCPGVLDWNAVWYVFEAPFAENDVYLNYCGTPGDIYTVGIVVYEGTLPLDCNAYILANGYAFNDCGDGTTNPDMNWDRLPGPTTYLIPVLADDGPLKAGMDFSFDITLTESPPLPPGGSCADPFPVSYTHLTLPTILRV